MKLYLRTLVALLLAASSPSVGQAAPPTLILPEVPDEATEAQPKLIKITATIDGSGRIIFTRQSVCYQHKSWSRPTNVYFGGEPWTNLAVTPPAWSECVDHLDLSKAWIVKRKGRDTIALEQTPDGFDLYLCDAPNGSAAYEVLLAIPRRR